METSLAHGIGAGVGTTGHGVLLGVPAGDGTTGVGTVGHGLLGDGTVGVGIVGAGTTGSGTTIGAGTTSTEIDTTAEDIQVLFQIDAIMV